MPGLSASVNASHSEGNGSYCRTCEMMQDMLQPSPDAAQLRGICRRVGAGGAGRRGRQEELEKPS